MISAIVLQKKMCQQQMPRSQPSAGSAHNLDVSVAETRSEAKKRPASNKKKLSKKKNNLSVAQLPPRNKDRIKRFIKEKKKKEFHNQVQEKIMELCKAIKINQNLGRLDEFVKKERSKSRCRIGFDKKSVTAVP